MATDVQSLAERVKNMSGADRLRLAAGLIDRGALDLAEPIVQMVADDLAAIRLLGLRK